MKNEIETLIELVNISSFSQKENKEIVNYILNKCKKYKTVRIKNNSDDRENLLIFINCEIKNCSPIVLCGHIDTVKENNNLPAKILDDKLYGLGSCDMKCFFASILAKLESLESLNTPIIIAITSDEEIECESVNLVIDYFKQNNITPTLTILGEPTDNTLSNCSKGCYEFNIDITGKPCHSSKVNEGINAINIAAKLITKIESLNTNKVSLNTGLISGGKQINIVPEKCSLNFDIRCFDSDIYKTTLNQIKEEIKKLKTIYSGAKIELKSTLTLPCYKSKSNLALSLCEKLSTKLTEFNAASEAGFYAEISKEVIIFGSGNILLAHKQNEYVEIKKLNNYYKMLEKLIKTMIF